MAKDEEKPSNYIYVVVAFATIGAILFGLDQGNWAGAIEKPGFIEAFCGDSAACQNAEDFPRHYTNFLSMGSALVQLGAFFGALLIAPLIAGRMGRREAMFFGCLVTVAGVVPMVLTTVPWAFEVARFIAGLGVGVVTFALPIFIAEVSPAALRGTLGSSFQLLMVGGMLIASFLNTQKWFGYRASFSLPLYPSVVLCLGIFCFPVSPRFALVKWRRKGDMAEGQKRARQALVTLRGSRNLAEQELRELQESLDNEEDESPWNVLWRDPSIRRRVLIANGLQWMQQFTGINALLSYGPSMMKTAHLQLNIEVAQFIITIVNLAFTAIMMNLIDRFGRRVLLLLGATSMFVFMTASGVVALMMEVYDYQYGMGNALLVCLCGYIASFGIGWGGVPWVYPSEIFPMDVKEKAMSTSVGSQWLANFLIAYLVPQQVGFLKLYGAFFFYSGCLLLIIFVVYAFVPETKGLPLENMDKLFGKRANSKYAEGTDVFVHVGDCVDGVPRPGGRLSFEVEESPHTPGQLRAKCVAGGTGWASFPPAFGGAPPAASW